MENKYCIFDIETTGLNPWYGNTITCICAKTNDDQVFCKTVENISEGNLIKEFINWLDDRPDYKFITVNGKDFDIPFILARLSILNVNLNVLDILLKRDHLDLCNDITSKKISLNDLVKLFNVSLKDGNGKKAIDLFFQKNFTELIKYCMNDVEITEQVYLKMQGLTDGI